MIVNIFGKGEVYKQIYPLLVEQEYKISNVVDDKSGIDVNSFLCKEGYSVVFCVGYKNLYKRLQRFKELKELGIKLVTFITRNAIVSAYATIGDGTIINQGAIIDNYVMVGDASFINIGAMISHDSIIGDGVFVAPGANILGFVTIGEGSFIGANSTIINNIKIGKHVVVAAGAVVIDNVPDNVMVAGNPAVIKKYL